MKILNGKRSALVFQLDNGQTLRVPAGQFSDPFIGTVAMMRAIISSGTPKQVGFVVSNSYELQIINEIPVAQSYYYAKEEDAVKAIIEGKDFNKPASNDPRDIEIAKLKDELALKSKEYEELKLQVAQSGTLSEEDVNHFKKIIADKDSEINAVQARNDSLLKQTEELTAEVATLKSNLNDLQVRYEKSSTELLEANNKLKAAVEATPEVQRNADGQTLEEVTDLFKRLQEQVPIEVKKYTDRIDQLTAQLQESQANSITADEVEKLKEQLADVEEGRQKAVNDVLTLNSTIEAKDAEIAKLKADGATIVESYNKAKAAVQEIMAKFHIGYVDGQYVQQAN